MFVSPHCTIVDNEHFIVKYILLEINTPMGETTKINIIILINFNDKYK